MHSTDRRCTYASVQGTGALSAGRAASRPCGPRRSDRPLPAPWEVRTAGSRSTGSLLHGVERGQQHRAREARVVHAEAVVALDQEVVPARPHDRVAGGEDRPAGPVPDAAQLAVPGGAAPQAELHALLTVDLCQIYRDNLGRVDPEVIRVLVSLRVPVADDGDPILGGQHLRADRYLDFMQQRLDPTLHPAGGHVRAVAAGADGGRGLEGVALL